LGNDLIQPLISAKPIAHISEDGRQHLLYDHLRGTAGLAAKFAAEFGCREWGYLAGLWHEIGKTALICLGYA